jgi:hypothetical protein
MAPPFAVRLDPMVVIVLLMEVVEVCKEPIWPVCVATNVERESS